MKSEKQTQNKPNSNLALSVVEWANLVRRRRITNERKIISNNELQKNKPCLERSRMGQFKANSKLALSVVEWAHLVRRRRIAKMNLKSLAKKPATPKNILKAIVP